MSRFWFLASIATAGFMIVGCGFTGTSPSSPIPATAETSPTQKAKPSDDEHGHKPGAHGGIMVSVGAENYHVEAVFEKGGVLHLYTLGSDESKVIDVEQQQMTAYVKAAGESAATPIAIEPRPQPGDAQGKTSQFIGQLPAELAMKSVVVTIPSIVIGGDRFRISFASAVEPAHAAEDMPPKIENDEERELYLTPGGLYTAADIEANGRKTASETFAGVMSAHDMKPKPGDKICPVTMTKANPKFTWIVGGKAYEFCCPPCVDEFVKTAKERPDEVKQPQEYVKP